MVVRFTAKGEPCSLVRCGCVLVSAYVAALASRGLASGQVCLLAIRKLLALLDYFGIAVKATERSDSLSGLLRGLLSDQAFGYCNFTAVDEVRLDREEDFVLGA